MFAMVRGQSSLEYAALVGVLLLLSLPVVYYAYSTFQSNARITMAQAVVDRIYQAGEFVRAQGPGSKVTVQAAFPDGVESANASGREVLIQVFTPSGAITEVYRTMPVPISYFVMTTGAGPKWFEVEYSANGNITLRNAAEQNELPDSTPTPAATVTPTPSPTPSPTPAPATVVAGAMSAFYRTATSRQPYYSYLASDAWSGPAPAAALNGTASAKVVVRASPSRDEYVMVVQDWGNNITALVWNGSAWGSQFNLSVGGAAGAMSRSFDVAYQDLSGKAVVAYRKMSNTTVPYYRTWDGSVWSSESEATTVGSGTNITWIRMAGRNNSNEIALLAMTSANALYGTYYDGAAWLPYTLFENNIPCTYQCFDVAFERNSGKALAAYREGAVTIPRYRTYSGGWSAEGSAKDTGGKPAWIRLEPNPTSNEIMMGSLDDTNDLNMQPWGGAAWGNDVELDANLESITTRPFDQAYMANGTPMVAYGRSGVTAPSFRTYAGGSWTSAGSAMATGNANWISISANQTGTGGLMLVQENLGNDVIAQSWNGSGFGAYAGLETSSDPALENAAVAVKRVP